MFGGLVGSLVFLRRGWALRTEFLFLGLSLVCCGSIVRGDITLRGFYDEVV